MRIEERIYNIFICLFNKNISQQAQIVTGDNFVICDIENHFTNKYIGLQLLSDNNNNNLKKK